MFDYHMHSRVSFDGHDTGLDLAKAALAAGLKIRRGMEFGMDLHNLAQFKQDLTRRHFDFVLGSIHFVDDLDVYFEPFWSGKTVFLAERRCLEATLDCVRLHDDFDVLAHLTYIGKT